MCELSIQWRHSFGILGDGVCDESVLGDVVGFCHTWEARGRHIPYMDTMTREDVINENGYFYG